MKVCCAFGSMVCDALGRVLQLNVGLWPGCSMLNCHNAVPGTHTQQHKLPLLLLSSLKLHQPAGSVAGSQSAHAE